jgi:methylene-tetrahydromethanopterin dehydrogenase
MNGRTVAVFGAGPVGLCTAILASNQGARVKLCQLTADDDEKSALRFCERYKAEVEWVSAQTQEEKIEILKEAEIVICAARAGVRILNTAELKHATKLLVAADTNAVPPSGVAGIGVQDMGVKVDCEGASFLSIGPLAIGNLKYKVQFGLYQKAHQDFKAALIDFPDAYDFAMFVLTERAKRKVA